MELLPNRTVLSINGADAETFLEGLVTCSVLNMSADEARHGALLSPQGKILFDFLVLYHDDQYLIDVDQTLADTLQKRLIFYRLRAKVDIEKTDLSIWYHALPEAEAVEKSLCIADPRHPALGFRIYKKSNDANMSANTSYLQKRITLGVPEGGIDFQYGEAYPHEVLMDQYQEPATGVDFSKGCFVGQEVVSRMQHRASVKKRIIQVSADETLPETGTEIKADGKPAGFLGSSLGTQGLALLRLDRVHQANQITANGVTLHPQIPDWAGFGWTAQ